MTCSRWPGCGCGTQSGPHTCEGTEEERLVPRYHQGATLKLARRIFTEAELQKMPEKVFALHISNRFMEDADRFGGRDPDGDECVLARQYLRALEKIERLTRIVAAIEREVFADTPPWPLRDYDRDAIRRELADEWAPVLPPEPKP